MLVRDVIKATARAGAVTQDELLSRTQRREILRLRQVGMLLSSRLVAQPWTVIGRAWANRERGTCEKAATLAETRVASKDPETLALIKDILQLLDCHELPPARPVKATPRRSAKTIKTQIAVHQARIRSLRLRLRTIEGDAR
jgi:hypothetical protein